MISMVRPLYAGNALQLRIDPPAGSRLWRVLRKGADTFTGEADPGAFIAYEGTDAVIVDAAFLNNDVPIFYRAYYFDGAVWTASASTTGTPRATYQDASTDALELLRDRLAAGLEVETVRGTLKPGEGFIQVLTAPPAADGQVRMPFVSVHLTSEDRGESGIGEEVGPDSFSSLTDEWVEQEGWLARVQIEVTGWSLNPDERIALRKALRRIVIANFAVFDAAGMVEIGFSQNDVDAVGGEYGAPVYQVVCNFSCQAPVRVEARVDPIADVQINNNQP